MLSYETQCNVEHGRIGSGIWEPIIFGVDSKAVLPEDMFVCNGRSANDTIIERACMPCLAKQVDQAQRYPKSHDEQLCLNVKVLLELAPRVPFAAFPITTGACGRGQNAQRQHVWENTDSIV